MEVGILLLIGFILPCPLGMLWMRRRRHGRSHNADHSSGNVKSPRSLPEQRSDRASE